MVFTRGMSHNTQSIFDEMLHNASNFNDDVENIVTNLSFTFKQLIANHPDIIFSDVESSICSLLKLVDDALSSERSAGAAAKVQKEQILALEDQLQREKLRRRSEMNDSVNAQDIIIGENDALVKDNNVMLSKLTSVRSEIESVNAECTTLKSLVTEKDTVIDKLKLSLEDNVCDNTKLKNSVAILKSKILETEEKSWLNSRWVDDKVLDSFFDSFTVNNESALSKVVFVGATVTQLVKFGSPQDVETLMSSLSFSKADYVFLCVNNNYLAFKDDSGSHWSMLFIEIASGGVFHFDSLRNTNIFAAKTVTAKLGFNESCIVEVNCPQQTNAFECGLNVLLNTKFVYEGFCKKVASGHIGFIDWYTKFQTQSPLDVNVYSGRNVTNKCMPSIPSVIDLRNPLLDNSSKNSVFEVLLDKDSVSVPSNLNTWKKVKSRNKFKKMSKSAQKVRQGLACENKFHVLEDKESLGEYSRAVRNVSGVWKEKSVKPFVKNTRVLVNRNKQDFSKTTSNDKSKECEQVRNDCNVSEPVRETKSEFEPMGETLLIGDSLLRYSSLKCKMEGAIVDINPGAKIDHIRDKLGKYASVQPKVVYLLVGTNNLVNSYNGGQGYDGGWGKRAVLHSMAELLSTAKKTFPDSRILLNSILVRCDIRKHALLSFNEQLYLMCNNFNVEFVDVSNVIKIHQLARDGRHLSRSGNTLLGEVIHQSIVKAMGDINILSNGPCFEIPQAGPNESRQPACSSFHSISGNEEGGLLLHLE